MKSPKEITIHTDGACLGNPGPGGYGVVLRFGEYRKELFGGFRLTTNNRMEIMAAIEGLKALKCHCKVTLYSDSKYLVDAINKGWLENWITRNWRKSDKSRVQNIDLWSELRTLLGKHEITFLWVKGHSGNKENECCDILATEAAKGENLPADDYFENKEEDTTDFFSIT